LISTETEPRSETASTPVAAYTVRQRAAAILKWLGDWLSADTTSCIAVLVLAYVPLALLMAHAQRLTADEIYTYRIAQQPSIGSMIALSRKIDLHPPLHYLMQRAAIALPLPRWLGSRLPSLIAGQIGLLAVFLFLARRAGNLMGLLAASIYWLTPATDFSWSNRPYALWLCLLALTALFWDRTGEWDRPWWTPVALAGTGLAMVLDYMFGLPCLLPFIAAEAIRCYRRRRLDWPVLLALLLPSLAGLFYLKQVRDFAGNTFSPLYLPSFAMGLDVYSGQIVIPLAALGSCIAVAKALRAQDCRSEDNPRLVRDLSLRPEEWLMTGVLTGLPILLLAAAAIHRTQFFTRYGACAAVGFALLAACLVAKYTRASQAISVLMTCAILIASIVRASTDPLDLMSLRDSQAKGVPSARLEALDLSLPIVVAAATEFTELNDREPPPVARRLYYLTDRDAAQRYSGQTLFEGEEQTAKWLGLPGNALPLHDFLAAHTRFYLIGDYVTVEEWVMRYLMANGARLEYRGKYVSTTGSDDLYLVTVPNGE
jgi:Dolichyl-phosphate-mannose-protein mannosyltransferase